MNTFLRSNELDRRAVGASRAFPESAPAPAESRGRDSLQGRTHPVEIKDDRIGRGRTGRACRRPNRDHQGARLTDGSAEELGELATQAARIEIMRQLDALAVRLNRSPGKVYVMGQRTKWGNCSSLHNLSFNWRLIMAPDYVLRSRRHGPSTSPCPTTQKVLADGAKHLP